MAELNVLISTPDGDSRGGSSEHSLSTFDSPAEASHVRFGRVDRLLAAQPAVQAIREDVRAVLSSTYAVAANIVPSNEQGSIWHRVGNLEAN